MEDTEMARRLSVEGIALVLVILAAAGMSGVEAAVDRELREVATSEDVAGCTRPLLDLIYGFLLTLLALTVPFWGSWKHHLGHGKLDMALGLIVGAFTPLFDVGVNVVGSCRCVAMLWKYHHFPSLDYSSGCEGPMQASTKSPFRRFLSSLSPFSRPPLRILATSELILIYTLRESELLGNINNMLWAGSGVESEINEEFEAMVVGEFADGKTKERDYTRKELSHDGMLAFVLAGVLPDYDELKFLRGNSGFAMLAISVQAVGYVYAVVYRSVTHLEVAPLEVVGLIFNMYLLIKASVFSTYNPCHRPLVVFLNKEKNDTVVDFVSKHDNRHFDVPDVARSTGIILFAISFCSNAVLIYYVVNVLKSTSVIVAMPLIIFSTSSILEYIAFLYGHSASIFVVLAVCLGILLNATVYVWGMVVTVVFWKSEHFDTRAKSINLSQLVPFIG